MTPHARPSIDPEPSRLRLVAEFIAETLTMLFLFAVVLLWLFIAYGTGA
jgi:hypothetical protein